MDVRRATREDYDEVRELCDAIWPDRDVEYIDRVYPDWIVGEQKRTLVATTDTRIVGLVQGVRLSADEAWYQGLRVHPDVQGEGVASRLFDMLDSWAADGGATVVRCWVYSWNDAGMGLMRSLGFDAVTSFRWARPEPVAGPIPASVSRDPAHAWAIWNESEARAMFDGLSLDRTEQWALSTCTRQDIEADEPLSISEGEAKAMTYVARAAEHNGSVQLVYATAAWNRLSASRTLFRAINAHGASRGADEIRVPIPEQPQRIADVAASRIPIDTESHFVFERQLR